jgi:hypothetical protein
MPWLQPCRVQSPCNPLIGDYTKILYTIDEVDIPSTQCKVSLNGLNSVGNVDGLSFSSIDFVMFQRSHYVS